MPPEISDEMLCAYIDDELAPPECAALNQRIASDAVLRARACEFWQTKQMVQGAYPPAAQKRSTARKQNLPRWPHALAASLLLLFGTFAGWLMHERVDTERLLAGQIDAIRSDGGRVVLHLFSDEPERMEAALSTAEQLVTARDSNGQPFRVEFIANGPGLHLLRTGGSPYAARVAALGGHANLRLLACRQAMERMRERGIDIALLPGVEEALSAENQLASRLTQGWRYLQS